MKAPVLSLILVVSAAPFAVADEVPAGSTLEEVRSTLGSPKGQVRMGDRQLVYYDRGEIELRHGRVVRTALRTPEEQAALAAREERLQADQEERQARLVAEGTALRDRKLTDAAFLASPVAYQVAFWESFARSYPGVPCVEPLTIARLKLNEQLEEKARQAEQTRRFAELEERLAAAEREPVHYRTGFPIYRGRHDRHHYQQEFALWPVKYTYYDAPLPVYTTPTTPLINPFAHDPAQPARRDRDHDRSKPDNWKHDRRGDRGAHHGWRGVDRGHGRGRDRM